MRLQQFPFLKVLILSPAIIHATLFRSILRPSSIGSRASMLRVATPTFDAHVSVSRQYSSSSSTAAPFQRPSHQPGPSQRLEASQAEDQDDPMSKFRGAVDKGSMATAVKLCRSTYPNDDMFNYVVVMKDQQFIFEFARKVGILKWKLLVTLYSHKKPLEMIEEAFRVFQFSQDDLMSAASKPELMCSPDDLFSLLDKIENPKDREAVIRFGVGNLIDNRRLKCLDPLLKIFESKESLKPLKDVAVRGAFRRGSLSGDLSVVKRFYNNPAITLREYGEALIWSGIGPTQNSVFGFLLKKADKKYLRAVKKSSWYRNGPERFKAAINKALLTTEPRGSRLSRTLRKVEQVEASKKDE